MRRKPIGQPIFTMVHIQILFHLLSSLPNMNILFLILFLILFSNEHQCIPDARAASKRWQLGVLIASYPCSDNACLDTHLLARLDSADGSTDFTTRESWFSSLLRHDRCYRRLPLMICQSTPPLILEKSPSPNCGRMPTNGGRSCLTAVVLGYRVSMATLGLPPTTLRYFTQVRLRRITSSVHGMGWCELVDEKVTMAG